MSRSGRRPCATGSASKPRSSKGFEAAGRQLELRRERVIVGIARSWSIEVVRERDGNVAPAHHFERRPPGRYGKNTSSIRLMSPPRATIWTGSLGPPSAGSPTGTAVRASASFWRLPLSRSGLPGLESTFTGAVGPTVLGGGPATPQLLLGASAAGGAAAVAAQRRRRGVRQERSASAGFPGAEAAGRAARWALANRERSF